MAESRKKLREIERRLEGIRLGEDVVGDEHKKKKKSGERKVKSKTSTTADNGKTQKNVQKKTLSPVKASPRKTKCTITEQEELDEVLRTILKAEKELYERILRYEVGVLCQLFFALGGR